MRMRDINDKIRECYADSRRRSESLDVLLLLLSGDAVRYVSAIAAADEKAAVNELGLMRFHAKDLVELLDKRNGWFA